MDHYALKNEIENDPENIGYAGKTDQEVADLLNQKNVNRLRSISINEVLIWAGKRGAFTKLKAHRNEPDHIGNLCETALAMFGSADSLDLENTDVQTMLGAFVSGGVFTQEDANSLLETATFKISRAESLGFNGLGAGDVNFARGL